MSNVPITTSSIQALLRPGIKTVLSDTNVYANSQWTPIFSFNTSDKSVEFDVEVKLLSMAEFKAEGGQTATDGMQQLFITQYQHAYVAIGFIITRQALKDNQYEAEFPRSLEALKDSLREAKNTAAGNVFNNAMNSSNPIGDGQTLLSTSHPIINGVIPNTFSTSVQLSEVAIEEALIQSQAFQNAAGLKVGCDPKYALVAPQSQFIIRTILNSDLRSGTGDNDINALKNSGLIRQGFLVNHYINVPSFWAVLHNHPNGFKYFEREKIDSDIFPDISNDNHFVRAIERYSLGCSNFRAIFGSMGF